MNKKQIAILTLALFVLFSGIFIIMRSIGGKNKPSSNSNLTKKTDNSLELNKEQIEFEEKFKRENKGESSTVMGVLVDMSDKGIAVKDIQSDQISNLNFGGDTKVVIVEGVGDGEKRTEATLVDLELNNMVKVEFDRETKVMLSIMIARPEKK